VGDHKRYYRSRIVREIKWRGGVGYGDTLNTITYSYSCTVRYDQPVYTVIHWPFDVNYKHITDDPETVIERFNYVESTVSRGAHEVTFDHVFLNKIPSFRYINNPDHNNPLHGVWYHNQRQTITKKVVVWSSRHNVDTVGHFKDPSIDQWDELIDWLTSQGYQVVEVTYRTPIDEVIHHINECCMGIGYDGMIHQLFKYLWKPIIVVCKRFELNQLLVPQAALVGSIDEIYNYGLDVLFKQSEINMRRVKKAHQRYLYANTVID
jgi:hypothetical protein